MYPIQVLVVDDSFFMRKIISDMLNESGIIQVIDTAKNGKEAIEKAQSLHPDVITMDVEMPQMDGIEALKKLMEINPIPVLMLSSLTKEGADTTLKALDYGAFDFLSKPSGSVSLNIKEIKKELIDKILIANSQKGKWGKQWNIKRKAEKKPTISRKDDVSGITTRTLNGIVAIGTSTGGPKALQDVISKVPRNFPYAIVIVQHMPAGFTNSLAKRLDSLSEIVVKEAEDQEEIKSGVAYIAPGNFHMEVKMSPQHYKINLNQEGQLNGHRPSVDILFNSLAEIPTSKIFVVMTGMGSDGTLGIRNAKKTNDICIAEDEETCVVFGMPKSAIHTGLVDMVVPLHHITNKIVDSVNKQRRWQSWK